MKKKIVILLAAMCAVSLLGGCKSSEKKESGNESAIEYDAEDYVTLGEYKGIEVSLSSTYEVTEEDVRSNVEKMIASFPMYEDTDKTTVEDGDLVNIDYEGLKDGVAFDGGTAEDTVLEIGSGSFIDGFESGLIGANVGDQVTLNLTFPEDYKNNPDLAGVPVVFNVTVNKIVTKADMTYDTLTDEYVNSNFSSYGYGTVEELMKGVKSNLQEQNEYDKESDTQEAVIKKLAEVCTVKELPEGLLDERVTEYMAQMKDNIKNTYQMEMEDYYSALGTTEEEFKEQVVDYMQENLESELILQAIAKKEKIDGDDKEFEEYVKGVVEDYGYESEDALIEMYGEDYVRSVFINNKTLEFVTENAKITYGAKQE